MLKLRSSSRSRPDPLFIAATEQEKPFFERNFKKYFGDEATWEEAIHGETGVRGFMVFAKLSKKTKSDLVIRLREAARAANYCPSLTPSPHLSPRPNTMITSPQSSPRINTHLSPLLLPRGNQNTSPLPSPRSIQNISPLPSPRYPPPDRSQRPQLRIQRPDDDAPYDPLLLQCGGLSPHLDSCDLNSEYATIGSNNSYNSSATNPISIRQTRSMPASPLNSSGPPQHARYPQPRSHQHSRSAHLSVNDISGLFDVTSFWDDDAESTAMPSSSLPATRVISSRKPGPRPSSFDSAGLLPVVDCGLGLEEFYDIYAASIAEEEARQAEQKRREEKRRELEMGGKREEDEEDEVNMSASFKGQQIVPDLMIHRAPTSDFEVRPPPRTRKELLALGWIREKGDTRDIRPMSR